ncbi:MAG: polysaccharide biosynthesis protein [Candidatus Magasanikbacteria bacterium]|nr:polysaccharide biosynthesis protein [Candidatus Magasanikbacteria bacterium]
MIKHRLVKSRSLPAKAPAATPPSDDSAWPKSFAKEFAGKRILVTGGTGSIGSALVKHLLQFKPLQIRVFSRDESKQWQLWHELNRNPLVRLLIGDIRDKDRVLRAMENVDIVFHAAAMKHVVACENDPFEAVKTNVSGTQNVIECALSVGVDKIIGVSTDKATDPVSVMGCTKLLAEKIMLASLHYRGDKPTKCCFVRFGNVLSTRGSVIPLFYQQIAAGGPVTVTDQRMQRFFISVDEAVRLVFQAAVMTRDREIFILKMPVLRVYDLARAMIELYAPRFGRSPREIKIELTGRKAGERFHEKLLTADEAEYAYETKDMFVITPVIGREDAFDRKIFEWPGAKKAGVRDYSTEGRRTLGLSAIKAKLAADEHCLARIVNPFSGILGG